MRNRMRSQPGEGRQCVRHARYRQYQPDSFLFRGLRATKRPTTPVAIGCIALLLSTRVPSSPDTTPVFITTSTQPLLFFFFAACACRTTFDEPPLRLHRCLLPRLCSSSMDFLSFFFSFRFVSSSFWIYRCLLRYSFFFLDG